MNEPDVATMQVAARVLINAALAIIESDPHQWSTRPCRSCLAVSRIVGRNFGCLAKAAQRKPEPSEYIDPQPVRVWQS